MTLATLPGYRVVDAVPLPTDEGLRNDVAAFVGPVARGPVGVPVRVASREAFVRTFGGWGLGRVPRAVAAYFANGGEVAWVVRAGLGGTEARATLSLTTDGEPDPPGMPGRALELRATSPGTWAERSIVRLTLRVFGPAGVPEADLSIEVAGQHPVRRAGLRIDQVPAVINATGLVEASFAGPPTPPAVGGGRAVRMSKATLAGGSDPVCDTFALRSAIVAQAQVEEVALVCLPDLAAMPDADQDELLEFVAESSATGQDRLAVVSLRCPDEATLSRWVQRVEDAVPDPSRRRAVAAYAGWLRAADLSGTGTDRYPVTDPVGHICGVIARLDRERGSGWSPANELVADAVDTADPLPPRLQAAALDRGVNLLRPKVGGGLEVWGAQTLDVGDGRHLAHRRLIHRIVRAMRRVAEPLVFDTDDELLRFSVARAISGVLMEAFRSGSLAGESPDEAYRVRCDESTTRPEDQDAGRVVCLAEVAIAVPMEFITLQLTLGAEGLLEVVER